jgi:hypothetical protein
MPRLALIDELPLLCDNPLELLNEMLGPHAYAKISNGTFLRRVQNDPSGAIQLWYEDTPLIRFEPLGLWLDFGGWASPSALARANAVLSLWGLYSERRGPEDGTFICRQKGPNLIFTREQREDDVIYLCEAGGRARPMKPGDKVFIPYTVENRTEEEAEEEVYV